jgi:hypothetical protein
LVIINLRKINLNSGGDILNTINQMKNIIVLKDLPSNIIEEAFVILKPNKKLKVNNNSENLSKEFEHTSEYIIKEAEMVINNYLSSADEETKIRSKTITRIENKYKRLKKVTAILGITFAINIINLLIK